MMKIVFVFLAFFAFATAHKVTTSPFMTTRGDVRLLPMTESPDCSDLAYSNLGPVVANGDTIKIQLVAGGHAEVPPTLAPPGSPIVPIPVDSECGTKACSAKGAVDHDTNTAVACGSYAMMWTIDGDEIEFQLKSNGQGWVSVGIQSPVDNKLLDTYQCSNVNNPDPAATDPFWVMDSTTNGLTAPVSDTAQGSPNNAVPKFYASDAEGTVCIFRRKLFTGDVKDVPITKGTFLVAWAYHDSNQDVSAFHTKRGTWRVNFLAGSNENCASPGAPGGGPADRKCWGAHCKDTGGSNVNTGGDNDQPSWGGSSWGGLDSLPKVSFPPCFPFCDRDHEDGGGSWGSDGDDESPWGSSGGKSWGSIGKGKSWGGESNEKGSWGGSRPEPEAPSNCKGANNGGDGGWGRPKKGSKSGWGGTKGNWGTGQGCILCPDESDDDGWGKGGGTPDTGGAWGGGKNGYGKKDFRDKGGCKKETGSQWGGPKLPKKGCKPKPPSQYPPSPPKDDGKFTVKMLCVNDPAGEKLDESEDHPKITYIKHGDVMFANVQVKTEFAAGVTLKHCTLSVWYKEISSVCIDFKVEGSAGAILPPPVPPTADQEVIGIVAEQPDDGGSAGAIAAAVIGGVALAGGLAFLYSRQRKASSSDEFNSATMNMTEGSAYNAPAAAGVAAQGYRNSTNANASVAPGMASMYSSQGGASEPSMSVNAAPNSMGREPSMYSSNGGGSQAPPSISVNAMPNGASGFNTSQGAGAPGSMGGGAAYGGGGGQALGSGAYAAGAGGGGGAGMTSGSAYAMGAGGGGGGSAGMGGAYGMGAGGGGGGGMAVAGAVGGTGMSSGNYGHGQRQSGQFMASGQYNTGGGAGAGGGMNSAGAQVSAMHTAGNNAPGVPDRNNTSAKANPGEYKEMLKYLHGKNQA